MNREITTGILARIGEERKKYIPAPAIGRFDAEVGGVRKVIWLTNEPGGDNVTFTQSFGGGTLGIEVGPARVLHQQGTANVYKNTRLGELLIMKNSGVHDFVSPAGERVISIHSKATYHPDVENVDAKQLRVFIGSGKPLELGSLRLWLHQMGQPELKEDEQRASDASIAPKDNLIVQSQEQLDELELERLIKEEEAQKKRDDQELLRLIQEEDKLREELAADTTSSQRDFALNLELIEQKREEQLRLKSQIVEIKSRRKQFIRTQQDLRTQHILDPIQEKIKRIHFFDDQYLVIEGGPGTGKTTTLIQRIKFLISSSIEEYLNEQGQSLSEEQQQVLFGNTHPWIFISPSRLLKEYLQSAMSQEGLHHLESAVVDWQSHKRDLCRKYKVYAAGSRLEAVSERHETFEQLFYFSDPARLRLLEGDFTNQLILTSSRKLVQFAEVDFDSKVLQVLQRNILNSVLGSEVRSIPEVIKAFELIRERYSENIIAGRNKGQEELRLMTKSKLVELNENEQKLRLVESIFSETEERSETDWISRLNDSSETIIRKKSAQSMGVEEHFTEREERILAVFPELVRFSDKQQGEYISFAYLFGTIGAGVNLNVFDLVIPTFRALRNKPEYAQAVRIASHQLLDFLLVDNRKIHPEEEAFLLGFINRLMLEFRKTSTWLFNESRESDRHSFHRGYLDAIKAVIAVDEVTDFGLVDIDCITSLKHPVINSVTFCGDLMQRITKGGLRNWKDFDSLLSRRISSTGSYCKIIPLERSYRQSPSVLEIARVLFRKQQKRPAPFKSFAERSPFEPIPKLFVHEDAKERIKWIAQYIRSISEDYGDGILPTIAVIVRNDEEVRKVSRFLEEEEAIRECGIPVDACEGGRVRGRRSSVRVFSVEFIKGLEFESVIFHDVDALHSQTSKDLIGKYLYVGISRAAYHLALTSSGELPESLDVIQPMLEKVH